MSAADVDRGLDARWRGVARGVGLVLLGIMVYGAAVLSRTDPGTAARRLERASLEQTLRELEVTRAKWDAFTAEEAELAQRLTTLDAMLPAREEAASPAVYVRDVAHRHAVDVLLVRQPKGGTMKGSYMAESIEIQASGTRGALLSFIDSLQRGGRIIRLTRLDLYPAVSGHRARIELEAYTFVRAATR